MHISSMGTEVRHEPNEHDIRSNPCGTAAVARLHYLHLYSVGVLGRTPTSVPPLDHVLHQPLSTVGAFFPDVGANSESSATAGPRVCSTSPSDRASTQYLSLRP
jgi:hypothetical protein